MIEYLRFYISKQLCKLANWIYPGNIYVRKFNEQMITDLAITGKHIVRINPQLLEKGEGE